MRKNLSITLVAAFALALFAAPAAGTFSIVAVDPITGEVGSAGASCIAGSIILSDPHPGVGVIHTQAYWNSTNQNNARIRMEQGWSPQEIIDWLVANDAGGNPTIRQYIIVDLVDGGRTAGHTGSNCSNWKGHLTETSYAVAGNILLGPEILDDMEAAFLATPGSLAQKMMAALQGANVPGADTRCMGNNKPAISAFIRVARPGDTAGNFYLDLNVNSTSGSNNPIDILQGLFDEWLPTPAPAEPAARGFALRQNRPNPFNPSTEIGFEMARTGQATIEIVDITGRRIVTLVDGERAAGAHRVTWRGTDASGRSLPSGVYFYRFEAPGFSDTRKMLLLQ
jgi:uncharacterized Ntn-hydrolase superfamily protein